MTGEDGQRSGKLVADGCQSYPVGCITLGRATTCSKNTDSAWAPVYVVNSNDKARARLNTLRHILDHVPYQDVPRER